MKQIKVEHTRTHRVIIPSGLSTPVYEDKLVTDAELVLVEPIEQELHTKANYLVVVNGWTYKPILISRTEKIGFMDWYFKDGEIRLWQGVMPEYHKLNGFKVLALPEHFSPKHLQAIVDGKLKEGKVLVECALFVTDEKDEATNLDINLKAYRIKLNSSNNITLYKAEEKMYTEEERNKAIWSAISTMVRSDQFDGSYTSARRWFEQNVK